MIFCCMYVGLVGLCHQFKSCIWLQNSNDSIWHLRIRQRRRFLRSDPGAEKPSLIIMWTAIGPTPYWSFLLPESNGGFHKWGTQQWMFFFFSRENPILQWMIGGYPYFRKPPNNNGLPCWISSFYVDLMWLCTQTSADTLLIRSCGEPRLSFSVGKPHFTLHKGRLGALLAVLFQCCLKMGHQDAKKGPIFLA